MPEIASLPASLFRRRWSLAAACLLVAACQTPAERAAAMEAEVNQMIQIYGPACARLGYEADSDQWRDCILRLNAQDNYYRYSRFPTTTTCFGHRGFFQCSSF